MVKYYRQAKQEGICWRCKKPAYKGRAGMALCIEHFREHYNRQKNRVRELKNIGFVMSKEIAYQYRNGMNIEELAKKFSRDRGRIIYHIRKHGISYNENWGILSAEARRLGISRARLWQIKKHEAKCCPSCGKSNPLWPKILCNECANKGKKRKPHLNLMERQQIIALFQQGWPARAISRKFNSPYSTVTSIIRKADYKSKPGPKGYKILLRYLKLIAEQLAMVMADKTILIMVIPKVLLWLDLIQRDMRPRKSLQDLFNCLRFCLSSTHNLNIVQNAVALARLHMVLTLLMEHLHDATDGDINGWLHMLEEVGYSFKEIPYYSSSCLVRDGEPKEGNQLKFYGLDNLSFEL
jgi:predicted amidophosphoribosyltransferase